MKTIIISFSSDRNSCKGAILISLINTLRFIYLLRHLALLKGASLRAVEHPIFFSSPPFFILKWPEQLWHRQLCYWLPHCAWQSHKKRDRDSLNLLPQVGGVAESLRIGCDQR